MSIDPKQDTVVRYRLRKHMHYRRLGQYSHPNFRHPTPCTVIDKTDIAKRAGKQTQRGAVKSRHYCLDEESEEAGEHGTGDASRGADNTGGVGLLSGSGRGRSAGGTSNRAAGSSRGGWHALGGGQGGGVAGSGGGWVWSSGVDADDWSNGNWSAWGGDRAGDWGGRAAGDWSGGSGGRAGDWSNRGH